LKDFTQGNVTRQLILFSLPMLAANVFQQLYNVVDSIVVGKYIGTVALAAVGASFPVIFVLISLLIGISSGITVVVSQFYGAKQNENVVKAINTFFVFIFVASIIMSALGVYFARDIFVALRLPAEILDSAVDYLQIYVGGMIFMFGFYGTNAILRGLGDSKTPLYFTIFSTLTNVVLDLVFVLYFGWGIKGVAYATVLAQFLAFILVTFFINRGNSFIHFSIKNLQFDWDIFKKSIKIGLPTGLQQSFVALGMIAILRIVNDFGTATVAAYSVAGRLDAFASMPAMAMASALAAFVGQNVGANKMDRVKAGFKVSLIFASIISVTVSAIILLFGKPLMSVFTNDAQVIELGYDYLIIVSSFYLVFSSMFITHGVLRGAGDTLVPMFITLFALWILRIPFSYLFSREFFGLGVNGIWWGIPLAWIFGFTASYFYYKMGRWRKNAVVKYDEIIPDEVL
jgi:putative MATE family efflux protein